MQVNSPALKRVLIVDDEESMRLLLRRHLESIPGLEFTLADGGDASLSLVADHSYDLILLDLLMPGVGGMEVLTRIRNSKANRATPVIIASVMADQHTQIACQSLGVSGYVVKPIERQALIKAVTSVLGD